MNEYIPIIIKGWGGTVPRPYIPVAIDGVGAVISGVTFGVKDGINKGYDV